MGIIAHEVRQRILAPQAEGTFHVQAFPTPEMLKDFHQKQLTAHPATYKEGRVAAGYHPLTPILPDTKHHAYIIVRQLTTDNRRQTESNQARLDCRRRGMIASVATTEAFASSRSLACEYRRRKSLQSRINGQLTKKAAYDTTFWGVP